MERAQHFLTCSSSGVAVILIEYLPPGSLLYQSRAPWPYLPQVISALYSPLRAVI